LEPAERNSPLLWFGNAIARSSENKEKPEPMSADNVIPLRPPRPCPICGKPSVAAFRPFCSARCADVDLNRWLSGAYVVPAGDQEAEEADDPDAPATTPDDDFEA
jgi:hypothetical protein